MTATLISFFILGLSTDNVSIRAAIVLRANDKIPKLHTIILLIVIFILFFVIPYHLLFWQR